MEEVLKMKKHFAFILIAVTGLLVSCVGEGRYGPQGTGTWGHMMHNGFGYGGIFMWIIFLVAIAALIYFLFQSQKKQDQPPVQNESPLDVLKRRYANGEIDKEEYDKIKKDL